MSAPMITDATGYSVFVHLAAARIESIHSLNEKLDSSKSHGQRTYQKLPRHMQRRAVSSNPKRMPVNKRQQHIKENVNAPRECKRPRTKYRRRATDKVEEYNHRQQQPGNTWLETHVWHAKRFHMHRAWGYALPARPTTKMYRPILRAVNGRCVMQDRSFMCCLELRGELSLLKDKLSHVLSQEGLKLATEVRCLSGSSWCNITLYHADMYPHGAISDVDMLWLPSKIATDPLCESASANVGITVGCTTESSKDSCSVARLWLWVHPSAYDEVVLLLVDVFDMEKTPELQSLDDLKMQSNEQDNGEIRDSDDSSTLQEQVDSIQENKENQGSTTDEECGDKETTGEVATKCESKKERNKSFDTSVSNNPTPKYKIKRKLKLLSERITGVDQPDYRNSTTGVTVTSLKDTLNRFQLRGPDSYSILQRVLAPSAVTSSCSSSAVDAEDQSGGLWWQSYYSDSKRKDAVSCNESAWLQLGQSQGACSSNLALPLVVRDPRVMLPTKRAKIEHSEDDPPGLPPPAPPSVAPGSALFDAGVRRSLLHCRYTDHQINQQRFLLEPRSQLLQLDDNEARLPVLLLLTAAQDKSNSCWDLIAPGGWGSNTWMSLVYSGAVAIGTDSETHFVHEEHTSPPHYLLPDTAAGKQYSQTLADERRNTFFRMPPNKRENFIKMGVHHPFHAPWVKLLDSLEHLPDMEAVSSGKIGTGFMDEVLTELGMKSGETNRDKSEEKTTLTKNSELWKCPENICVMRNPRYLKTLDYVICRSGSRRRLFRGVETPPADNKAECSSLNNASLDRQVDLEEAADTLGVVRLTCQKQLLRVMITIIGSGTIDPCAMICVPTPADIAKLECKLKGQCKPSVGFADGILEQKHEDVNEGERKQQRKEHQKDLARLRRRRKAARAGARDEHSQSLALAGQPKEGALTASMVAAVQKVHDKLQDVVKRSSSYLSSNQQLWLVPEDAPLQQCSRLIFGYVTEANFSRVRGCSAGQGFVVTGALLPLLQRRLHLWQRNEKCTEKPFKRMRPDGSNSTLDDGFCDSNLPLITDNGIVVLVRNTQTLQYRFGLLTLCEKQPPP